MHAKKQPFFCQTCEQDRLLKAKNQARGFNLHAYADAFNQQQRYGLLETKPPAI